MRLKYGTRKRKLHFVKQNMKNVIKHGCAVKILARLDKIVLWFSIVFMLLIIFNYEHLFIYIKMKLTLRCGTRSMTVSFIIK